MSKKTRSDPQRHPGWQRGGSPKRRVWKGVINGCRVDIRQYRGTFWIGMSMVGSGPFKTFEAAEAACRVMYV